MPLYWKSTRHHETLTTLHEHLFHFPWEWCLKSVYYLKTKINKLKIQNVLHGIETVMEMKQRLK